MRTNQERRDLHKTPDLAADIKGENWERLGRGIKMDYI
jgi:hypothetical protein